MRTGKSISNIGYVGEAYFNVIANTLKKSGKIGTCYWIAHQGEEGDKNHLHILLLGGQKTYNTEGLSACFGWDVVDGQKGSLTERWSVTKDIRDWLAYAIHDAKYLLRKGQERERIYDWSDIHCTEGDEDLLARDVIEAKRFVNEGENKIYRSLRVMAKLGYTWEQVMLSGLIPVNMLNACLPVWELLIRQVRGGDKHE